MLTLVYNFRRNPNGSFRITGIPGNEALTLRLQTCEVLGMT